MRSMALHLAVIGLLIALFFLLPPYHTGNLARIMVLATFAMGYNILFGYTGLLSLGHALFFTAGMYGLGLTIEHLGFPPLPALLAALATSVTTAAIIGFLALRTSGVAFMIVTLMFAQAGFLTVLYFGEYTRGDEGFVIQQPDRILLGIDLSQEANRYFAALVLFAVCLLLTGKLVASGFGKALVAIKENEERATMLGYDTTRLKLHAVIASGTMAGMAGAAYALLFGYVGASFASVQYSILPLLWVLLGGAGTTIGPLIGTVFMFYLIDYSSGITSAYMLIAGVVLVLLILFVRKGIAGAIRQHLWPGLP